MVYVSGAFGRPLKITRSLSSVPNHSRRTEGSRYLFRGRVYRRLYKLPQYTGEGEECFCCTLEDGCCGAVASLLCVVYLLVLIFCVQKNTTVKKPVHPQKEADTDFGTPVYVSRAPLHSQRYFHSGLLGSGYCQPKQNFVFIRHNKSANHILTNILQRFGDAKNLTFAIPACVSDGAECHSQLKWNLNRKFNIICDSVRFSKRLLQFMPVDSLYFTMVRNPLKQLSNQNCLHPVIHQSGGSSFCCEQQHALNELTYNLGFSDSASIQSVSSEFPYVKSLFNLVLIEEYFEESLLLLKKEMCWSFSDILYFIPKVKQYQHYKGYFSQNCNKVTISRVENKTVDMMLYNYFNASFWRRLDEYGENIKEDLVTLRFYVQLLSDACNNRFQQKVEEVHYNISEVITKPSLEYCLKAVKSNEQYSRYLSLKMQHLFKWKKDMKN